MHWAVRVFCLFLIMTDPEFSGFYCYLPTCGWIFCDSMDLDFPGKNTEVGCHFLIPGDLPDWGIKPVSPASPASPALQMEACSSVQFSRSVVSGSLRPCELQHARPPCPSPTPGVHPNPCPLSRWCHPTISSSVVPFLLQPSVFPSIRVFSNESVLHNRWPKYWSFSFNISPSSEHPGLISFRMDWLDLLAVQGDSQDSSPAPQFKSINSLVLSFLFNPTLTSIHDHWKNHSLD